MEFSERTEIVLGRENLKKLSKAKVIVFGVGGVGGYVAEMLVRTGIEEITIVDFDKVSVSNKNRQIIALDSTLNQNKVEVLKNRLLDINKNLKITAINEKLTEENIEKFKLQTFDYVIDCIDMVKSKIKLICYCNEKNIKLISSMGTGNRKGLPQFEVVDIFKTKNDGLARVLRHELKKLGVKKSMVVCSKNLPIQSEKLGSLVYFPASCACTICAYVVESIINS